MLAAGGWMLQTSRKLTWSASTFNVLSATLELLLQKSSVYFTALFYRLILQPGCLRYPRATQFAADAYGWATKPQL